MYKDIAHDDGSEKCQEKSQCKYNVGGMNIRKKLPSSVETTKGKMCNVLKSIFCWNMNYLNLVVGLNPVILPLTWKG